ncbi:hypothetical protein M231_02104 [Tremella mesenterica]|uniref:Uncharacterized protein n=2 Tax=Tremella mesenterica TaxID=5217 RepID=A0A4V1M4K1_TREME|nr:hypothetical protein M231_02104 [Tremella mesenterica]
MYKFGDPEWYETYVRPYRDIVWPPYESTFKPPKTSPELHKELERLKAERLARRQGTSTQPSSLASLTTLPTPTPASSDLDTPPGTEEVRRRQSGPWDWAAESDHRLV